MRFQGEGRLRKYFEMDGEKAFDTSTRHYLCFASNTVMGFLIPVEILPTITIEKTQGDGVMFSEKTSDGREGKRFTRQQRQAQKASN